jgi:hypothetical protein
MTVSPFSFLSRMNLVSMLPSWLLCHASGNPYVVHDLARGDTPVSGSESSDPVRLLLCDTEISGLPRDFRYASGAANGPGLDCRHPILGDRSPRRAATSVLQERRP